MWRKLLKKYVGLEYKLRHEHANYNYDYDMECFVNGLRNIFNQPNNEDVKLLLNNFFADEHNKLVFDYYFKTSSINLSKTKLGELLSNSDLPIHTLPLDTDLLNWLRACKEKIQPYAKRAAQLAPMKGKTLKEKSAFLNEQKILALQRSAQNLHLIYLVTKDPWAFEFGKAFMYGHSSIAIAEKRPDGSFKLIFRISLFNADQVEVEDFIPPRKMRSFYFKAVPIEVGTKEKLGKLEQLLHYINQSREIPSTGRQQEKTLVYRDGPWSQRASVPGGPEYSLLRQNCKDFVRTIFELEAVGISPAEMGLKNDEFISIPENDIPHLKKARLKKEGEFFILEHSNYSSFQDLNEATINDSSVVLAGRQEGETVRERMLQNSVTRAKEELRDLLKFDPTIARADFMGLVIPEERELYRRYFQCFDTLEALVPKNLKLKRDESYDFSELFLKRYQNIDFSEISLSMLYPKSLQVEEPIKYFQERLRKVLGCVQQQKHFSWEHHQRQSLDDYLKAYDYNIPLSLRKIRLELSELENWYYKHLFAFPSKMNRIKILRWALAQRELEPLFR
ncbi:MAG: hypothetical protein K0S63_434 [Gammaproteobacteria bacterium]|nr:hypothetical protein [Gammaproteobacteria bacterium]